LDRLCLILQELDAGVFLFCSSYGERLSFVNGMARDNVHEYFSTNGQWQGPYPRINLNLQWSYRPSATWDEVQAGQGKLYHFRFFPPARDNHYFDYRKILSNSTACHDQIAHFILDEMQCALEISIPAVIGDAPIIQTIERFYQLCVNFKTIPQTRAKEGLIFDLEEIEVLYKPFEAIALEWPHYVVPPGHAYAVLDPSCTPYSMFGI